MSEKANRRIILGSLFLCIILGCLSCTGPVPTATVAPTTASSPATNTAVVSPTLSSTSTPTASPTAKPTRTPKPTRTLAPTLTPTLLPEAKREIIERNLKVAGCEPPCWGGITPGKTVWRDALNMWQGLVVEVNGKSDFIYATLCLNELCSPTSSDRVEIWSKDETITGIYLRGRVPEEIGYVGTLSAYMASFQLPDVLEKYGPPSQVYGEGYVGEYYDRFWVAYADLGLLFRYMGDAVYDNAAPLICPVTEGAPSIAISFQVPGAGFQTLYEYANTMDRSAFAEGTWTAAENFSPETFYTAFRERGSPNCIQIPGAAWEDSVLLLPETFDPVFTADEDAALSELLATNGGCELPCWWGITPGVTRIEDVQTLFAGYGKPMRLSTYGDDLSTYYVGLFARHDPAPLDYVVKQSFDVKDGVVAAIRVIGDAPMSDIFGDGPYPFIRYSGGEQVLTNSRYLAQDWRRYALASTMKLLGIPSQVLIAYNQLECYDGYHIAIVYDDLEIMAQYGGKVQNQDGKIVICPSVKDVTDIGFLLTTPDSETEWDGQLQACYPACEPVMLEDAAGIQPGTFYQTYVNPDTTACFEVREELGVWCP